jgi:hypothetical protein
MKKGLLLFLLCAFVLPAAAQFTVKNCEFPTKPGMKLSGRIKVITEGAATFRVRVIPPQSGEIASVRVKVVDRVGFGDACGRWHFVDDMEQFTVKFVTELEDFTIRFVDNMEGSR